jgi:IS1 family transposase
MRKPGPKGEGQTNLVEALNGSLRQRCAVLVRKSCSFSKSGIMHAVRIKICIDDHKRRVMLG